MKNNKRDCSFEPEPASLFRAGPATWAGVSTQWKEGSRESLTHDRRATAVVGDSSKPAPEMGGEKVLWQGGGVVDQFEGQGEGGCSLVRPSMVVWVSGGEWRQ
jgi:hypothetical protein